MEGKENSKEVDEDGTPETKDEGTLVHGVATL